MADEIKIKAPSIEQKINVNVTGEAEIRRLYTELQAAQTSLDRVNSTLQATEGELDRVKTQFNNFAHGNGIDVLQDELERFRNTAQHSINEFQTFLQSVNLNDIYGSNDWQFSDLFKQIKDGSITASQAIMRVKTDMRFLMEENYQASGGLFDSQIVQEFTASLDHLGNSIETVIDRLNNIERGGVKSAGDVGGDMSSALQQIENAARGMSDEIKESYNSITALLTAMKEYASLDDAKLLGVSQAFRNIADIGKGNYGTKSIENIVYLTQQLQALNGAGTTVRFDLNGLSELKVSKASMSNLATYLPQIAAVNVSKLKELSQINLTNFNNIKVSKSSIENIAKLSEAIQILKDAKAASVSVNNDSIGIGAADKNKEDASHFKDAKQAVKDYYDILTKLNKSKSDVKLTSKGWTSESGYWNELASALNRTKTAFDIFTSAESRNKMSQEEQATLTKLLASETEKYTLAIEEQAQREAAALERKAEAAKKAAAAQEAADKKRQDADKKKEANAQIGSNLQTYKTEVENFSKEIDNFVKNNSASNATVTINADTAPAIEAAKTLKQNLDSYKDTTLSATTTQESFNLKMSEAHAQFSKMKLAVQGAKDETARLARAEKENLKDSIALSKAIIATNRAYKQATDAVQKYTAAKRGKSSAQYSVLEREAAALKILDEQLNNGAVSQKEYIEQVTQANARIQESIAIIKANGEAHLSLGDKVRVAAEKFSQFFGVSKIISTAWRATQQMVKATIELDDAFTQLKIVTGATDDEMEQFSKTAIELAKSLGQSVADVTKSIETFSRLGYNLPDASELAKYATVLANTAAVSTDEATTGLTSIIKGFNLNVSDAEHVSDVLIQVGQKYAVSAGELMEAFERSGAALSATNVSFEKGAGLVAAANASIQNAATVGTALKTVSARIRGSKSDLEDLGEDASDLTEGFSKYAKEIKALTGFNILVDGSTTEFKDLYDIMEGIAQIWDKLSDTSQARVAEILGGTRQLQVISGIIGNWGDAAGAYDEAMNSAGVATKANETYMNSVTARINQFKASFEEISTDLLSSKVLGGAVTFGTRVLNTLDGIVKLLNKVPGELGGIATAAAAILSFKSVGELINQFQYQIILWIEYAHEISTNSNMNESIL